VLSRRQSKSESSFLFMLVRFWRRTGAEDGGVPASHDCRSNGVADAQRATIYMLIDGSDDKEWYSTAMGYRRRSRRVDRVRWVDLLNGFLQGWCQVAKETPALVPLPITPPPFTFTLFCSASPPTTSHWALGRASLPKLWLIKLLLTPIKNPDPTSRSLEAIDLF
jgi:hypothetical protein